MPDSRFDPFTNGHRRSTNGHGASTHGHGRPGNGHGRESPEPEAAPSNGRGVLLVAIVSAMTGLNLMLGAGVGLLIAQPIGLRGDSAGILMLVAAALGGILGVIFGVRVAHRFGGTGEGARARILAVIAGLLGLVGAVAVASTSGIPFAPIIAVMLPGIGAWLGDRAAERTA